MREPDLLAWAEERFAGEGLLVPEPPPHHGRSVRHSLVAAEGQAISHIRVPDAGPISLEELLELRAPPPPPSG